jgi:hypothetical protein
MKSETPNSSLGFKSGINYFFIFGSDSETIHVKSQYSTSYRFTNQFLEENPSLYSDPSIIPRFQFSIYTIKNKFPSVEIELPNPKSKPSKKKESSVENWILQLILLYKTNLSWNVAFVNPELQPDIFPYEIL